MVLSNGDVVPVLPSCIVLEVSVLQRMLQQHPQLRERVLADADSNPSLPTNLHHSVLPALSTEVAEAWERIIRDRKIKFCSNLEKTFADRVQDSRWGRPEWLAILLQRASGQAVWRDFYELATLACQARVQITEKEWLLQARGFGKLFTQTEHHQHRQLISSVSRGKKRGWAELNLAAHPASNTVVAGQG